MLKGVILSNEYEPSFEINKFSEGKYKYILTNIENLSLSTFKIKYLLNKIT